MVVVVDDDERENEGDLVAAAATMTAEQMAFVVRHTTGIVCAPMTAHRADVLELPPMVERNTDAHGTAFTITVDHVSTGTGVSAEEPSGDVRALAADTTESPDCADRVTSSAARPRGWGSSPGPDTPRRPSICCVSPRR